MKFESLCSHQGLSQEAEKSRAASALGRKTSSVLINCLLTPSELQQVLSGRACGSQLLIVISDELCFIL